MKNSAHLVQTIRGPPIHMNLMVSLDIVNLFSKVSIKEGLSLVQDNLELEPPPPLQDNL